MEHPWLLLLPVSLGFLALYALFAVYAERKVSAFMQDRLGPMEVGPKGLFQTVADILKLLLKETIQPARADKLLFLLAPILVFCSVFAGFAVLPLAPGLAPSAMEVGLLYLLAIVSIDVIGLLLAGWSSNNKYALMGSVRSVSQIIAYEVPAGLALLAAVLTYGSLNLVEIVQLQGATSTEPVYFLGVWDVSAIGGLPAWGAFRYPHLLAGLGVYFIAGLAEANRAPFDIPEAESELIAGFHTEYSGFRFAVLFLAEYGVMLLVALVASILFLGGYHTPLPNLQALPEQLQSAHLSVGELFRHLQFATLTQGYPGSVPGVLWAVFWLLLKASVLVYIMIWIRWTFPRLRPDQLMRLCWKYLTPAAILLVLISIGWKLAEVYGHLQP